MFLDEIVRMSRIPSPRRRQDLLRELAAHVEDFELAAREAGRSEEEIQRQLAKNFGDPQEIARQFAWVYRRERMLLHLAVFPISTVVVALIVAASAMSLQAGVALSFGAPALQLGSRHSIVEALDILATAAAYMASISLEKHFDRRRVWAALAVAAAAFAIVGLLPQVVLFGLLNAALLRMVQVSFSHPAARLAAVCCGFGVLGAIFFHPSASALALTAGSWLAMAAAYQAMTHLAARVDGALLNRFQQS
jgi:hypothetical protein